MVRPDPLLALVADPDGSLLMNTGNTPALGPPELQLRASGALYTATLSASSPASRGANALALGRLEHDSRWLVTLSTGPDVAASLRFVTSWRGRAEPPDPAGAAARGR